MPHLYGQEMALATIQKLALATDEVERNAPTWVGGAAFFLAAAGYLWWRSSRVDDRAKTRTYRRSSVALVAWSGLMLLRVALGA